MRLREDKRRGFFLEGLREVGCTTSDDLAQALAFALSVAPPERRSHTLVTIYVRRLDADGTVFTACLRVMDLAGRSLACALP
mmetsp:Transcript_46541/g.63384  ORF Transcript_46541/g.63384 Transcript_46541/m.63384 type:complete len:82 (-) Transcript_46541:767-1012(-)